MRFDFAARFIGTVKDFSQICRCLGGATGVIALHPSSFSSSSDTSRYRLQPHSFSTMYFSLAVTSISADLPSGNVPTTRVRRRISLFSCSMALFVPILVQCCMGKSVCASWRARRNGSLVRRHLPAELLESSSPCCPAASPSQVAALGRTGRRAGRTASRPRCRPWPPGRRPSALSARCSGCRYCPLVRKLAGSSGQ